MKRARSNRSVRLALATVLAAVALLHLRILWSRLADGSVLEPVVAGRWLFSLAVILLAVGVRSRGLSLVRGRPALILWLVVIMLHGVALVPSVETVALDSMPAEILLIVTPVGLGAATLFWARAVMTRRAGEVPFALPPQGAPSPGSASPFDLLLLVAAGPRAPPR